MVRRLEPSMCSPACGMWPVRLSIHAAHDMCRVRMKMAERSASNQWHAELQALHLITCFADMSQCVRFHIVQALDWLQGRDIQSGHSTSSGEAFGSQACSYAPTWYHKYALCLRGCSVTPSDVSSQVIQSSGQRWVT